MRCKRVVLWLIETVTWWSSIILGGELEQGHSTELPQCTVLLVDAVRVVVGICWIIS
jgi:hypothetical protein